ncbi:S1 family peptidase [Kribbella sp. NBC_00359]|uniref:S1 family peptidase n=1 Tax=Kribbella sp. NBC_00359 TaxID=2975966 RepID=UPI003FA5B40E
MDVPFQAYLAEIAVVDLSGEESRGSGYLVASGWVLTAAHVVSGAARISVWLGVPSRKRKENGLAVDLAAVRVIPELDLALMAVPGRPSGFVPAPFGALDRQSAADMPAVAAGFPWFKLRAPRLAATR